MESALKDPFPTSHASASGLKGGRAHWGATGGKLIAGRELGIQTFILQAGVQGEESAGGTVSHLVVCRVYA